MPILRLRIDYDTTNKYGQVDLKIGGLPAQPLTLKESIIKLAGADTSVEQFVVEIPWLKSFDINTNGGIVGIPIFTKGGQLHRNIHDLRVIPSSDIPQEFRCVLYQDNETDAYVTNNVVIELLFEYNRPALI